MNDERENLSWQGSGEASRELAKVIAAGGFEPDLILPIARGRLFPAGPPGYALAVKDLHVVNIEFYVRRKTRTAVGASDDLCRAHPSSPARMPGSTIATSLV